MKKHFVFVLILLVLTKNQSRAQIAVAADRMNALYIGLSNPISIAVSDVPDSCLRIVPSQGVLAKFGKGRFEWSIGRRDSLEAKLTLFDTCKNERVGEQVFRLKKIPEPVARLGGQHQSTTMGNGEFKAQGGIAMIVECCGFDAKATVIGFESIFYDHLTNSVWIGKNLGGRWTKETQEHVNKVKPGDWAIFRKIDYRVPGDDGPQRTIQELFFRIK